MVFAFEEESHSANNYVMLLLKFEHLIENHPSQIYFLIQANYFTLLTFSIMCFRIHAKLLLSIMYFSLMLESCLTNKIWSKPSQSSLVSTVKEQSRACINEIWILFSCQALKLIYKVSFHQLLRNRKRSSEYNNYYLWQMQICSQLVNFRVEEISSSSR